eukprot:gene12360-16474_t
MITLYHAPQSRSSRIIWLLEELGAPYRIEQVSIFRPMTGAGGPDEVNPHPDKQVPAIMQGDEVVAESIAILLYLTDAFPAAGLGPLAGEPGRVKQPVSSAAEAAIIIATAGREKKRISIMGKFRPTSSDRRPRHNRENFFRRSRRPHPPPRVAHFAIVRASIPFP